MTRAWTWVARDVVRAIHERQLAEHGGGAGLRDEGLLRSALASPETLALYGQPDAADLAAAYAFGIVRNHPFVDGNNRTAWVIARVFFAINGATLQFDPMDAASSVERLAAGSVGEPAMAAWFRARIDPPAPCYLVSRDLLEIKWIAKLPRIIEKCGKNIYIIC